MVELKTAEEAARETVKKRLADEITKINARIARAIEEGKSYTSTGFKPYAETLQLLENAGYTLDIYTGSVDICWKKRIDAIRKDATRLAEVAKGAGITVVKPE